MEAEFKREVEQLEAEQLMQYITSFERIGFQKGIEESQNQIRQVLLKSLALGLKLKFGSLGQNLLPEIELIEDVSVLETILSAIETSSNVSQLRQIYQSSTTDTQPEV